MIVVTGATGHLGRLTIEALLEKGVPANQLIAAVRSPEKAADLAARGVQVRKADYTQPESLETAFAGVEKVLLISGSEVGQRVAQHRAVIDAAKKAGVKLLAYTSILKASTATFRLAAEHQATEALIRAANIPFVLLRNGWYLENYTENLQPALAHGALLGSAGNGQVAPATRADFAAAAAVVLSTPGHENKVYELAGTPLTLEALAAEIGRQSGKQVVYKDLPPEAFVSVLTQAGVPEIMAGILADCDQAIQRGELTDDSGELAQLIGRPVTSAAAAIAAALAH